MFRTGTGTGTLLLVLQFCLCAQDDDIAKRVRQAVFSEKTNWSDTDRGVIADSLTQALRQPGVDSAQRERAYAAIPLAVRSYQPVVQPLLAGEWAQYNNRFPLPPDLPDREKKAAINVVVTLIDEGLTRPIPTDLEAQKIREQIDYLYSEARSIVTAHVTGEGADTEFDWELRTGSSIEKRRIGNPFYLGIDRPLSKEEIDVVLQKIQVEAAKVDGMVIGARLKPEDRTSPKQ